VIVPERHITTPVHRRDDRPVQILEIGSRDISPTAAEITLVHIMFANESGVFQQFYIGGFASRIQKEFEQVREGHVAVSAENTMTGAIVLGVYSAKFFKIFIVGVINNFSLNCV